MRDMIPRGDRSIRNIPVPANHRRAEHDLPPRAPRRRRHGSLIVFGLVALAILGGGAALLSTTFSGASVEIVPRAEAVTLPATIAAERNAPVGKLAYKTVSITEDATAAVPAEGTRQVSRQASGVLTVYNAYSTATQRLIANTRFAAPDGKIYRIHNSIVVPGATKKADGSLTPGSIAVTAYADSPGPDYNRDGTTKYTLPALKNDARYTKLYAQSGPITGGFVGTEPAVAASDLSAAQSDLKNRLADQVTAAASTGIEEGSIIVPGSIKISYGDVVQTMGEGATASLAQRATAEAAVIRLSDLASAVAARSIDEYKGEAVAFANPSAVSIGMAASSNLEQGTITLELSGSPAIVWQFDPSALKEAMLGKDKDSFQSIVAAFQPAIARADARIRPFWTSSFPTDPQKISISVKPVE